MEGGREGGREGGGGGREGVEEGGKGGREAAAAVFQIPITMTAITINSKYL